MISTYISEGFILDVGWDETELNYIMDYRAGEHLRDAWVGRGDICLLILNITVPNSLVFETCGSVTYSRS